MRPKRLLVLCALGLVCLMVGWGLAKLAGASTTPSVGVDVVGPSYAIVGVGEIVWTGGTYGLRSWSRDGIPAGIEPDLAGATVYDLSENAGILWVATDHGTYGVDASDGRLVANIRTGVTRSVLATQDRLYTGGRTLRAYLYDGTPVAAWTIPVAATDQSVHSHTIVPAFRDLVTTRWGIAGACQCDSVNGHPTKALVGFGHAGRLLNWPGPRVNRFPAAFGISLTRYRGVIYAGFGGSDSVEAYDVRSGRRLWRTDVTGSAQVVRIRGGNLWVGGHFRRVADDEGEQCYHPIDPECFYSPHLFVAHLRTGHVIKRRTPSACCAYNGIWSLMNDGTTLWIGGEFMEVGYGWYPDDDPTAAEDLRPRNPVPAHNLIRIG